MVLSELSYIILISLFRIQMVHSSKTANYSAAPCRKTTVKLHFDEEGTI